MEVDTDTAGKVTVLNSEWYSVRNYNMWLGTDFPATAQIGIVTYKDSWGFVKTRIGVAEGLRLEDDVVRIIDTGNHFYGYNMPEGGQND